MGFGEKLSDGIHGMVRTSGDEPYERRPRKEKGTPWLRRHQAVRNGIFVIAALVASNAAVQFIHGRMEDPLERQANSQLDSAGVQHNRPVGVTQLFALGPDGIHVELLGQDSDGNKGCNIPVGYENGQFTFAAVDSIAGRPVPIEGVGDDHTTAPANQEGAATMLAILGCKPIPTEPN